MYELSTIYPEISGLQADYGWEAPYALTAEGLPYLGPHRNFPFHLFAFGDASHTVTGAYLASRILLRHHLGEATATDTAIGYASVIERNWFALRRDHPRTPTGADPLRVLHISDIHLTPVGTG